ncbi:MAG: sensor histidine kinase, partial [Pseudonocardia sp.]|nr:sensor histidine kinase [Pseudonocardia sp.]
MGSRLLVIMVFVVGMLAVGLGVPLAVANAAATQREMFTQRLSDTNAFASSAERPLTDADTVALEESLRRYDELYGDPVLVLDRDGDLVVSSRTPVPVLDDEGAERVLLARARQYAAPYPLLMPWDDRPMVIAQPILDDTELRGIVVMISSTAEVRADELRVWSLIAAAGLVALAVGVAVAVPVI